MVTIFRCGSLRAVSRSVAATLDHVEPAGPEIGEPYGRVRNWQIDDAVELDLVLVPVIAEALQDNAVLRDTFEKFERTCANRMGAEIFARCQRRLGDITIPARSVSCARRGANGADSTSFTV